MANEKWKISIDTGGTFTDCIATTPDGRKLRTKVLSSGELKGVLTRKNGQWFEADFDYQPSKDIFKEYSMIIKGRTYGVRDFDKPGSFLLFPVPKNLEFPVAFSLTAKEEAPILGARILTETPLGKDFPDMEFRLGTTKGTNALLTLSGAKTLLITTKGFKDLPYIGTQQRPNLFQLDIPEPELLHSAYIEVDERISAQGEILRALSNAELDRIVEVAKNSGCNSIAIALLNAYINPIHETKIAERLKSEHFEYVSVSSQLHPFIHLLPRMRTSIINAYLEPVMKDYLNHIQSSIPGLSVMGSAAGLMDANTFKPKDGLLSGPAGGVLGAAKVAEAYGFNKVLTLDMGGTSTDVARFDGKPDFRYSTKIGKQEVAVPTVDIETVAAGGGSLCYFDGHKLCVGPESAGASPGPACYGAGGGLTITDVNLLLGKLNPEGFRIPIFKDKAEAALEKIQLDILKKTEEVYSKTELLKGFEEIADEKMAAAIRKISLSKGFDPSNYKLLAFGGAGGLHICSIAELLHIDTVIAPFEGGILSAVGIHGAETECWASKQVLKEWDNKDDISSIFIELKKEALLQLKNKGISDNLIAIKNRFIYLRLKGQNHSLEFDCTENNIFNLPDLFKINYEKLFGYFPENPTIEIESIKVVGTSLFNKKEKVYSINNTTYDSIQGNGKFLKWKNLYEGTEVLGPAVISNEFGTLYVKEGWAAQATEKKDIILRKTQEAQGEKSHKKAIESELFTNRFMAIAENTGLQLQRTAFSVNIKERLDFSCAVLDANAELLANAPHIPVHLGSLGVCARLILADFPLEEGDVIITNHPKYGGSHLPDVTLIKAAFSDNGELIGYLINRAHHAEIGGKRPGSMPPDAQNLEEEGVVISPTYLVKNGEPNWEKIKDILIQAKYPTRALSENIADINAALSSLKSGEEALKKLVRENGLDKVHFYMNELKERATLELQKSIQPYCNKKLSATEFLDDNHQIKIQVEINSKGDIHIDFSDSSKVHPRNLNANPSIVNSVVIYVLRLICNNPRIPLNEGLMKNVKITLPKNSFISPDFSDDPEKCPAVVGGNTEVSQRMTDTLLKAFGLSACSQGTMNNFLFGNEHFGYYETIGGGTGAGKGFHGRSAVHQHMTNTKITDPEEMEFRYPVRLHEFSIRKGSGGKGNFNGGDGIIREVEFLEDMDITVITQHRIQTPYGLLGGKPGMVGMQSIIRKNGKIEPLEHVDKTRVHAGDRIRIETPGGGGYSQSEQVP